MMIAVSLLWKYGEPNQLGITWIRQDIITVIQTSHWHSTHHSDATDSQLCYCDTESRLRQRLTFLCLTVCYPVTTVVGHCDPSNAANYNNLYNLPVMALSTHWEKLLESSGGGREREWSLRVTSQRFWTLRRLWRVWSREILAILREVLRLLRGPGERRGRRGRLPGSGVTVNRCGAVQELHFNNGNEDVSC